MTVTAQVVYTVYRETVGGTNHDGTYTMPELVEKLTGERPVKGWQAVARFCEHHADSVAASARETIESQTLKIGSLHNENVNLKKRIAELEAETVPARLVELERCHAITVGKVNAHGEILAKLQGLQD